MTPQNARRILGLRPDEDPRPQFAELENARASIAALVDSAPNEGLAERYRKGLAEFDEALDAVRAENAEAPEAPVIPVDAESVFEKSPEALAPTPDPAPAFVPAPLPPPAAIKSVFEKSLEAPTPAPAPVSTAEIPVKSDPSALPVPAPDSPAPPPPGRALSYLVWFFVFLVGVAGGTLLYIKDQRAKHERNQTRVDFLANQGALYSENRQWQEAETQFEEIRRIFPDSEIAARGLREVAEGRSDEQRQFVGYWTGQATAELEAGRLDEAEAAARKVMERFPDEPETPVLLEKIAAARLTQERDAAIAGARKLLETKDFPAAIAAARKILAAAPDNADAKSIATEGEAGAAQAAADSAKAREMFAAAQARDEGKFDQETLDLLRQAAALSPKDAEIAALLEKFSSYTRTLRVPGDFDNPIDAIAAARARDRVVLAAGTWTGPLVIDAAIELQGAGPAETIVECAPDAGSAITLGPDADGARVSGISFRHNAFAAGADRFSAALVRGGGVSFSDCHFTQASGHGLAVIEAGRVTVSRCRFAENGWDGVTAIGKGSTLEIADSVALGNFEHGIETWDGAACILRNNRCEGNSRNGIHTDNGLASATIEDNQLTANREFGLVLDSAATGKITGNIAKSNLRGGIVIRAAAAKLPVTGNTATLNQGPGLVLEQGLPVQAYQSNSISKNTGVQVMPGADLTRAPGMPAKDEAKIPRAIIVREPSSGE